MKWYLLIYVFGQLSMTAGPLYNEAACTELKRVRAAEMDENFAKLPVGTGFLSDGRMVLRPDITMDCEARLQFPSPTGQPIFEPRHNRGIGGVW